MVYNIGTAKAIEIGELTRARMGKDSLVNVFDWDKLADEIIKRNGNVSNVEIGLAEDWGCTSGAIIEDGKYNKDAYFFVQSIWATPTAVIDGIDISCCKKGEEIKNHNETIPEIFFDKLKKYNITFEERKRIITA
jgi:hypothetical protein